MPPIRVLLVDNDATFLQVAARFLHRHSFRVVGQAASGDLALEQLAQLQPDLVLMDLAMPGMNGLEATRAIKAQPYPPRVVILTLYDTVEYRGMAELMGADGLVAKSDLGTHLVPLIQALFAQRPAGRLKE